MAKIKNLTISCADKDAEQMKLTHCWQQCKMVQKLWKIVWQVL